MAKTGLRDNLSYAVIGIVIVLILALAYQGMNIDYKVEGGAIKINWFNGVTIPIKDITEIKVLEKAPPIKKIVGVDLLNIKQGTYEMEGIGRVKLYSNDMSRKIIIIKTDKMTYAITPENTAQFVRIINIK